MPEDYSSTKQVAFWQGQFGDEYTARNSAAPDLLRSRTAMWSNILKATAGRSPASIAEIGANLGTNLRALRNLSSARLVAVEPNASAREQLIKDHVVAASDLHDGIAAALPLPDGSVDLAFTSGVLIHIHPDDLLASCREIHRVSSRYIVTIEYFADQPTEIVYRGNTGYLFKRDFGGYWLDNFDGLQLLDYGFVWKRATGLDNLTWWIFEKRD
ncbi:MAG: methyltransferase domain-containing protein [Muricauda sp. TMED12]|nr:MAG: methyltransferase domain-containing protein [Muricauda sp. TMED12]